MTIWPLSWFRHARPRVRITITFGRNSAADVYRLEQAETWLLGITADNAEREVVRERSAA